MISVAAHGERGDGGGGGGRACATGSRRPGSSRTRTKEQGSVLETCDENPPSWEEEEEVEEEFGVKKIHYNNIIRNSEYFTRRVCLHTSCPLSL